MVRVPCFDDIINDRSRYLPLAGLVVRFAAVVTAWLSLVLPAEPGWALAQHWLFTPTIAVLLLIYAAAGVLYWWERAPSFAPLAVTCLDVVAISACLMFTGGWSSPYIPLFFLLMIGTTVFGSTRQTLVVALGGIVLLGAALLAQTANLAVFVGGMGPNDHVSIRIWTILLGLALCAFFALPANVYLQRRLAEYQAIIREREERLSAANRELTQSFYDLESLTDRVRADHDSEHEARQKLLVAQRFAKLGQLAAGSIQDMTNPLTAIIAELEMFLLKPDERPGKGAEMAQRVLASASHLAKMLESLRLFARQRTEMLYGAIDMHLLIRHCVEALEPLRRQRSAACNLLLNEQNPKVLGVESQIEQVLVNLLTNAFQALSGPGGQVTIRTQTKGERVRVEIEDNGVGIAADLLDKIFEPFYTTRDEGNALGLGLHTAKWIIEEHGGELSVRSTPGVATIFAFELPIAPAGGART